MEGDVIIMRLEQLEYLREIGKYGNMTRAAEAVHVSQPTLSEAIKRLEVELELPLLERYHNGVALTEAGCHVVKTAEIIFQQLDLLQTQLELLHAVQKECVEKIKLEVTPFLGNTYLFRFLQACREKTKWEVTVEIRDAQDIIERILQKKIQAGIVLMEHQVVQEMKATQPNLFFFLLCEGHLQVVLHKEHPLNQYQQIPLKQFFQYPMLFLKNKCIPVQQILSQYGAVNLVMESDIYTLPNHFLKEEKGVCLVSSVLLNYFERNPFDDEDLVVKELELAISTDLHLVMTQGYVMQDIGQQFQQFVQNNFVYKTS